MTPPLVPPDLDLRDFAFMPLDVARLRDSGLATRASGDAFRAAVLLWCAAWHQVPCASLEDDDHEFAKLAGYGRDLRGWRKVRIDALRGWVKCDDGRLYHPVVAEKALEGWIEKLAQRKSSEAGNAKLCNLAFDPTNHDAAMEAAKARLFALNPRSRVLNKKGRRYAPGHPAGTKETTKSHPDGYPVGIPDRSPNEHLDVIPTGPQETGKGQGQGQGHLSLSAADGGIGARDDAYRRFSIAHPRGLDEPDAVRRELGKRLDQDVPIDEIVAGAERYAAECRGRDRQHIGAPAKWLADGKWHDGKPKPKATLTAAERFVKVTRDSPQGHAWNEHKLATTGKPAKWILNHVAGYFPTEWPPGHEHRDAAE